MAEGLEPGVRAAVESALALLEKLGATLEEVSLPSTRGGAQHLLHHRPRRVLGQPGADGRGPLRLPRRPPVAHRQLPGDARPGLRPRGQAPGHARHLRALQRLLRRLLPQGAEGAHPHRAKNSTAPSRRWTPWSAPPLRSSPSPRGSRSDPLSMYLCDVLTLPVNLAGLPRHLGAVRPERGPPGRPAGDRAAIRGRAGAPRRPRLPGGDRVARGAAPPASGRGDRTP